MLIFCLQWSRIHYDYSYSYSIQLILWPKTGASTLFENFVWETAKYIFRNTAKISSKTRHEEKNVFQEFWEYSKEIL